MVEQLCEELLSCVAVILDPTSARDKRAQCSETIDKFKQEDEQCLQCGSLLAAQDQNPVARHFGLQLIENMVKHRWPSVAEESRQEYQRFLVNFLNTGVTARDPSYVREAVIRLTVETTKRMWPQLWQSFLQDMTTISNSGVVQTELVLGVFRRLSEDIHEYGGLGLDQVRKKQMSHAFNDSITHIFTVVLQNLEQPGTQDMTEHFKLREASLDTLISLLEWVEFEVLLGDDCKLLSLLCTQLTVEQLKTKATECLLVVLARKGDIRRTAPHRERMLHLLFRDALEVFWSVSVQASNSALTDGRLQEDQYIFIKRMTQILTHLGTSQLGPLWLNAKESFQVPPQFSVYLEVLLNFTKLGSQLVTMTTCDVWHTFVNHNHIKDNEQFKQFLPKVLEECRKQLKKVGDPAMENHLASMYSRCDFEDEVQFLHFFSIFRSKLSRIIGNISLLMPRTVARVAMETLQRLVGSTTDTSCDHHSDQYLEWEAWSSFVDCWMNSIKSDPSNMDIDVVKECGVTMLRLLVSFSSQSGLILQCQFKCLQSPLVHFLQLDQQLFDEYMKKIFSSVGFLGGFSDKHALPKDVVQARSAIVQSFTHLCEVYPQQLAPHLEEFIGFYNQLVQKDELVAAEKTSFIEALLILSLQFESMEYQDKCLKTLFSEAQGLFQTAQSAVASVEAFIQYLTLDKEPDSPQYLPTRKREFSYIIGATVAIIKRLHPLERAQSSSNSRLQLLLPVVVNFCVPLLRILYQLWTGQYRELLSKHFRTLHELNAHENDVVLGKTMGRRIDVSRDELHYVQVCLSTLHEGCLQVIVLSLEVFGYELMWEHKLVAAPLEVVIFGASTLNHYRLKTLIRLLVVPIVSKCPEILWEDLLYPMLKQVCHHVFDKLKKSWGAVSQKQGQTVSDVASEPEEVFFEQLTTLLSREYANLLDHVCVRKVENTSVKKEAESVGADDVEMIENGVGEDDTGSVMKWSQFCVLSPLAEKLLAIEEMRDVLVYSSFIGLLWPDSYTATKCTDVAGLLYEKVMMADPPEVVAEFFSQVLHGLQVHGTRDNVKSQLSFLALLIYQSAIFKFPNIENILLESCQVDKSKTSAFKVLLEKNPPATVKKKKEKFKDLIANVIGKHVGELYKYRPTFDLPEMEFKKKRDHTKVTETDLSSLFQQD